MNQVGGMRFDPPVLGRACLTRDRLLDRLAERFTRPLTVVSAPAGMGKTTLLAQAVAAYRGSDTRIDRWLTCGPDDAAPSRLAEGLCRAVGVVPAATAEASIDAVVDAVWHLSPAEVCLVLDDVHEIPAGSPGAELLARLVTALPGNGHLVLAGRGAPPVPLARLEVRGDVARLGEPDLLFSDAERDAFAGQRGVAPDRLAGCAGWPALSELAVTAVPQVEAAYLWEEVLQRLAPPRRRDLALLAHVGPFDEELARAVLDRDVTVAELTADLPLVAATSSGGWQIHGLWRSHLAGAVDAADIAAARRRAGLALSDRGDLAAAARQLAAAEAWDDLNALVTGALGAAHPPPPGDVVASWLGRLPDHLAQGPLGRLLAAVVDAPRRPAAAIDELIAAAEAFRAAGDVAGELACVGQLGQLAWWAEDAALMQRLVLRLFELEASGSEDAVPLACVARALIADLVGDSQRVLDELGRIPPVWLRGTWVSMVEWLRSMALHHLGRPDEALVAATRAHKAATPLLAPIIESTRLQALWYMGDIEPAIEGLPRLAEWAAGTGMRDNAALMAAGAAMVYAAVGRSGDAVRYLDLARLTGANAAAGDGLEAPGPPDAPLVDAYVTVAEASTAIARGDEDAAARRLIAYLERSPVIDAGVAAAVHRRSLTLWYVLVPATRKVWDAADLGPCYDHARRLAAALAAVREGRATKGRLPALGEPKMVRALLPAPWAVELALAYAAAARPEGPALLEALWPGAQSEVRRHAEAPAGPLGKAARAALSRLPVPPTSRLELRLLGTAVELRRDGELVDTPEWRRERVRSLLAYLAAHRPALRERVALDLWPDMDAEAQSRNLRVTLTHLLRVLEPERAERDASFLVRVHGSRLALHESDWIDVDLWHFDQAWERATAADRAGRPPAALDAMQEALGLWHGDPGELTLFDWALPAVEERRRRLVTLACRAGELLLARGEHDEARRAAEVALANDPWSARADHVLTATGGPTGATGTSGPGG